MFAVVSLTTIRAHVLIFLFFSNEIEWVSYVQRLTHSLNLLDLIHRFQNVKSLIWSSILTLHFSKLRKFTLGSCLVISLLLTRFFWLLFRLGPSNNSSWSRYKFIRFCRMRLHSTSDVNRTTSIHFLNVEFSVYTSKLLLIRNLILKRTIWRFTSFWRNDCWATHPFIAFLDLMKDFSMSFTRDPLLIELLVDSLFSLIESWIDVLSIFKNSLRIHLKSIIWISFSFNLIIVFIISLNALFMILVNTILFW